MHDFRRLDRKVQKILATLAGVATSDHDGVERKVNLLFRNEGVDQLQSRLRFRVCEVGGELAIMPVKIHYLLPVQRHHTTIGIHDLDTVVDFRVVGRSDHETDRLFVTQRIRK